MTCIVGLRTDTGVLLAGDSLATDNDAAWPRNDNKVFRLSKEVAIGFAGSYRSGQILRYHVNLPTLLPEEDEFDWAVKQFIPEVREKFKEYGYEAGSNFLLAVRGRLLQVYDEQVAESTFDFDACGIGESVARGTLYVLSESDLPARTILRKALDAACTFTTVCRGPYTFAETRV